MDLVSYEQLLDEFPCVNYGEISLQTLHHDNIKIIRNHLKLVHVEYCASEWIYYYLDVPPDFHVL